MSCAPRHNCTCHALHLHPPTSAVAAVRLLVSVLRHALIATTALLSQRTPPSGPCSRRLRLLPLSLMRLRPAPTLPSSTRPSPLAGPRASSCTSTWSASRCGTLRCVRMTVASHRSELTHCVPYSCPTHNRTVSTRRWRANAIPTSCTTLWASFRTARCASPRTITVAAAACLRWVRPPTSPSCARR